MYPFKKRKEEEKKYYEFEEKGENRKIFLVENNNITNDRYRRM